MVLAEQLRKGGRQPVSGRKDVESAVQNHWSVSGWRADMFE